MVHWKVFHKKKATHHPAAWYRNWDEVPEVRRPVLEKTMFHDVYTDFNAFGIEM